jgi:hypothetical protein
MIDGIKDVVVRLEQQKSAIDKALEALRGIESGDGHRSGVELAEEGPKRGRPAKRKGGMSPEGKQRLIAALKRRWAARKAAQGGAVVEAPAAAPATKKRGMTPDGRRRLAEAMRKRWAVKRAGSAVKKAGRKKAAGGVAA